jgi:hypothetical protein
MYGIESKFNLLLASSDWRLSSSSDPAALMVVDGTGRFTDYGPHYSRRTPGSRTFTGVGQEVVLIHESGAAVWAVVRQKTPAKVGSGNSRGKNGQTDSKTRYVWRNMLFRRLPECPKRSSDIIRSALTATLAVWEERYGELPDEPLRTEVDTRAIRSKNPGCCYKKAGWKPEKMVRGKLYLLAPIPCRFCERTGTVSIAR